MDKLEYEDLNRFLVSIGVVLITLSFAIPYFYLREDFGLYIEAERLSKFSPTVQDLILAKQAQVARLHHWISWVPPTLFIAGALGLVVGLHRWFKRQSKIDQKLDKELEKLGLEIVIMTPATLAQKEERAKEEVEEISTDTTRYQANTTSQSAADYLRAYMAIEQRVVEVFNSYHSPNFETFVQQRIQNKYNVDVLLKSNSKKYADRIVEIKYFREDITTKNALNIISNFHTLVSFYRGSINAKVVPVLVIVYTSAHISTGSKNRFTERISDHVRGLHNLSGLRLVFIDEPEIERFDVAKTLKKQVGFTVIDDKPER